MAAVTRETARGILNAVDSLAGLAVRPRDVKRQIGGRVPWIRSDMRALAQSGALEVTADAFRPGPNFDATRDAANWDADDGTDAPAWPLR